MAMARVNTIHEDIRLNDLKSLKARVSKCWACLEERDQQGLTPLYKAVYSYWMDGALLMLEHGADVQNSALPPQALRNSHLPLLHMAVSTYHEGLVKKLVKKGIDIAIKDSEGYDCVGRVSEMCKAKAFKWIAEAITERGNRRPNLEKDLLFVIHITYLYTHDRNAVEKFIEQQSRCHQKKMLRLFAACRRIMTPDEVETFRHYWTRAAQCQPCYHDDTEDELDSESVFDILRTSEFSQPDNILNARIQALFAVEKYMSEYDMLTGAARDVADRLCVDNRAVIAVEVLDRLTTVRPLYMAEVVSIMPSLSNALEVLGKATDVPFAAFTASLNVISSCLSYLPVDASAIQLIHCHYGRVEEVKEALNRLVSNVLRLVVIYLGVENSLKPPEIELFSSLMRKVVWGFPRCRDWSFFHRLKELDPGFANNAALTKVMVKYSAEALGQVRQSSPHLMTDMNGDTPLHGFARKSDRKFLVEEGVLSCFLEHGADLHTRNNQGERVQDLLRRDVCTEGESFPR